MASSNPNESAPREPGLLDLAKGRLGRQTLATLSFQVVAMALTLGVAIVLARLLGVEGFGAYALAVAWIQILLVPGMLGMDSLMVRETARLGEVQPGAIRSHTRWASKAVLATSLATAVIGGGLVVALQSANGWFVVLPQLIALAMLPLWGVTRIWQGVLRGVGRVFAGQLPESLFAPVVILIGAGIVELSPLELTPGLAVGLRIMGLLGAIIVLAAVLRRSLPPGRVEPIGTTASRAMLRSAFALGLISAAFLVVTRTDVVMLGVMSDLESVGSYTVATRGARFVVFPLLSLHLVLAPAVAAAFAAGNRRRLQQVVKWGTRGAFVSALPIALAFVVFGDLYLQLFGSEFATGLAPLRILVVGALAASMAGSVGLVMTMTGHEAVAAKVVGSAALLNVLLNVALIPPLGASGAAIATAVTTIVWRLMLVVWIRRHLMVDATVMGATLRETPTGLEAWEEASTD